MLGVVLFKIVFLTFLSFKVFATPLHVVIIRHAEKPESGSELSQKGFSRANALVGLFTNSDLSKKYNIPQFLFASMPQHEIGSIRSIQTLIPLSNYLNIPIEKGFKRNDYKELTREVLTNPIYDGKTILIAWPHKKIREIIDNLGVTNFTKKWEDKTFDRLWIVNYKDQQFLSIDDLPQKLIIGDSSI